MNMRTETEEDRGEREERGGKEAGFAWRALLVTEPCRSMRIFRVTRKADVR